MPLIQEVLLTQNVPVPATVEELEEIAQETAKTGNSNPLIGIVVSFVLLVFAGAFIFKMVKGRGSTNGKIVVAIEILIAFVGIRAIVVECLMNHNFPLIDICFVIGLLIARYIFKRMGGTGFFD